MDNFIISNVDDSGNLTLRLSDYAAWALLRRLQGEAASDSIEDEFVNQTITRIEETLTGA